MGTPFDYVVVDSSLDLTSYLPTSGTAPYLCVVIIKRETLIRNRYSAIVSVDQNALTKAQQSTIVAYQQAFNVKWAIVGSRGSGLSGITVGNKVNTVCHL